MATATASKPKAPRTIVSTKITEKGVETKIAASVLEQFERSRDLLVLLRQVHDYTELAGQAHDSLNALLAKTNGTTSP